MQNDRRKSVMGRCLDNPCLQCCIRVVRWVPVVFIVAVLGWAYYAFVFQLCFCKLICILKLKTFSHCDKRGRKSLLSGGIPCAHVSFSLFLLSDCLLGDCKATTGRELKKIFFLKVMDFQFHLSVEVRRELESANDDAEFRQILERYVHLHQLPVTNRGYDGGKILVLVKNNFYNCFHKF